MRNVTMPRALALAAGILLSAAAPALAAPPTIYALTTSQHLISFNSATPGTIASDVAITGVPAAQTLVGMDFRPATGELVALGYDQGTQTARLYVIDRTSGAATTLGTSLTDFSINLGTEAAANIGLDFNPTVDRIRVVSADLNANFRLNPVTGTVAVTDTNLAYAVTDVNAARNPNITAVAYTSSYLGATSTTLFDAELVPGAGVDVILSSQSPPNNGTLNTVGSGNQPAQLLDLDFDIFNDLTSGTQTGYTVATYFAGPGQFVNQLGVINFATATITNSGSVGAAPTAASIVDIAVFIDRTVPAVTGTIAWALQATGNSFVTFDTDNPTFIRNLRAITGIAEPTIAGFDTRPNTGELFALGYNPAGEIARLYVVAPGTGVATAIGAGTFTLAGAGSSPIGFDFNPAVDRIRVVTTTGKNYRLNPNSGGIAATDLDLGYAAGDLRAGNSTNIGTAAYTNSFAGASTTTLFTIDEQFEQLNTQAPPNNGTQNTVGAGSLGISLNPADRSVDLDILTPPAGTPTTAFLTANVNGANPVVATFDNLYTVNLTSGVASFVSRIGGGIAIRDFALRLPVAKFWTGATSTVWNTGTNWNPAGAPTSTDNIVIPSAPVNQPTLSNPGTANLVLINAGATLTMGPNALLSLNNNLTNNGTINADRGSNVTLQKATLQVISGSGSTTFGSLFVTGTAGASLEAASSGIQIIGGLLLGTNLTTNGRPLTLLSDATGTATVVNGGGIVVGNATVQRHITTTAPGIPGLGYRLLSSPVTNSTVGDLTTAGFTAVANSAFNAPANPSGVKPYPNVFGFNEARFPGNSSTFGQGYFSPVGSSAQATDAPLVVGRGYSVYMPGTAKPDFVGTLNNGNQTISGLTRTGNNPKTGWHLLGNPFPTMLDWDLVTLPAGMDLTAYTARTTGGTGVVYTPLVNGGASGNDLLAVAQAFFVRLTSGNNLSITLPQSARVNNFADQPVYRVAPDTRPMAHLTLRRADQSATDADATDVVFQDRALTAVKLRAEGAAASIFALAGGQELAIQSLSPAAVEAATVPLGLNLPVAGTYVLSAAELRNFAPGAVTLVDARTNTSYDLTQQPDVRFTATAPGADLTRFSLRFGRGASVTAVSTLSLDVYPNPVGAAANLTVTALGIGQGATAEVGLYDALGRAVLHQTVAVTSESASAVFNTCNLRPGAYTLRLTTATGAPLTRQVVVE
ncbi:MAG: DUF4394 domain-containing protein [Hymenobacteraceae bacterium]|nr:DUF4394 domain-containing protein [Hymenobacteraceae bacterium]